MKTNLNNFTNLRFRGIKVFCVLAGMLAFTLTSCNDEAVTPQKQEQGSQFHDKKDFFATDGEGDDDDDAFKPPREGNGGGGSGGSGD